jgi:hypothetical protein
MHDSPEKNTRIHLTFVSVIDKFRPGEIEEGTSFFANRYDASFYLYFRNEIISNN